MEIYLQLNLFYNIYNIQKNLIQSVTSQHRSESDNSRSFEIYIDVLLLHHTQQIFSIITPGIILYSQK